MAINVGSNFLYQGRKYLDDRLNKAKSIEDLKNWTIPVPDGFEIFVENSWYEFNSTNPVDPKLGKFKKRSEVSQDFGNSTDMSISQATITEKFNNVDSNLNKLLGSVFPLEFKTISGGGNFEVGSVVNPKINWTVGIKGESELIKPDEAYVNDSISGVSKDKLSYNILGEIITFSTPGTKTYKIKVLSGYLEKETNVNFNFYYRKFFGTSNKPTLQTSDIIGKINFTDQFLTSHKLNSTQFDCTGGKYPYYIIPKTIYDSSNLEVWVGGLRNTDLIIETIDLQISTGLILQYVTIRLRNIQNGKLTIEIK